MSTSTSVPVQQCRLCGSIVPIVSGADRHKTICRLEDNVPSSKFNQMATVNFPCPVVALKRTSLVSDVLEKRSVAVGIQNLDTKPRSVSRRKSSLQALKMLELLSDNSSESLEDDDAEWDDGSQYLKIQNEENCEDWDFKSENLRVKKEAKIVDLEEKKERKSMKKAKTHYGFRCSQCPARFDYDVYLEKHEDCVHGEGSKGRTIFTCPICKRMLHTRLVYQSHIKNHENAEALEIGFNLWKKWPSQKSKGQPFSSNCKFCVIPLRNHKMFLSHMKLEHKDKSRDAKYSCTYCSTPKEENFETMKLLFRHIQTCHSMEYYGTKTKNPETIECKVCKKVINYLYYKDHMRRRHSNQTSEVNKPKKMHFPCPLNGCGTILSSSFRMRNHFIINHLQNNPYTCPFPGCNVKCDVLYYLKRHVELHSGKAFQCEKCQLCFSRKDKLRLHKCEEEHPKTRIIQSQRDGNGIERSHYSHLRLKRLPVTDEKATKIDFKDMLKEKERIKINDIIRSDPTYVQACREIPDFKNLIFPKPEKRIQKKKGTVSSETYKCGRCVKSFNTMKGLEKHNKTAHDSCGAKKNVTSGRAKGKKKSRVQKKARKILESESDSESESDHDWEPENDLVRTEVKTEIEEQLEFSIVKIETESVIEVGTTGTDMETSIVKGEPIDDAIDMEWETQSRPDLSVASIDMKTDASSDVLFYGSDNEVNEV